MAILDAATQLSSNQLPGPGTVPSQNVFDTWSDNGAARFSRDNGLRLLAQVTTAFAGGTSLTAYVVEADTPDLANAVTRMTSMTLAEAALTPGTKLFDVAVPGLRKRYLALQFYSIGTHTAGGVTAALTFDTDVADVSPIETGGIAA